MDMLKQREDESKFEYKIRLCNAKLDKEIDLDWCELVELLGLDCSSDHLRKLSYGYKEFHTYVKEKQMNELSDTSILDEINQAKKELEIMKFQFQDQKREYRNYLRMEARWQHLIDEMIKEIQKLHTYRPLIETPIIPKGDRIATLILSDFHLGMVNNTRHNVYNIEVAKQRLEKLYAEVVEKIKLHNVDKLHIELCGDLTHGIIHLGTRINAEEDVISQTMLVSEMLSDFVFKLSDKVNSIDVHGTLGNHSRVSENIKKSISVENFERLITWYMRPRLINCKNVNIFDNYEEDIILYKVFDMNICSVHGHKEKCKQAVVNMSKFLKIWIDELHLGHWHSNSMSNDNDLVTIINGSFCGADEYAQDIRKCNKPSQTLIIYNKEGQECLYNIKL